MGWLGFIIKLSCSRIFFSLRSVKLKLQETLQKGLVRTEDSKLIFKMNIENTGVEDMPISFGTHPYFYFPKSVLPNFKTSLGEEFDNSSLDWDKGFDLVFICIILSKQQCLASLMLSIQLNKRGEL